MKIIFTISFLFLFFLCNQSAQSQTGCVQINQATPPYTTDNNIYGISLGTTVPNCGACSLDIRGKPVYSNTPTGTFITACYNFSIVGATRQCAISRGGTSYSGGFLLQNLTYLCPLDDYLPVLLFLSSFLTVFLIRRSLYVNNSNFRD